jgi:GNAT superfamily N-acetyltransferase
MTGDETVADILYRVNPSVTNEALDSLFNASWPGHVEKNFQMELNHSLLFICAYADERLVGFVNVAWNGGIHAFLLDTTVHTSYRRKGIGSYLVRKAAMLAQAKGMHWLHVDYEPHLTHFYRECGFRATQAGLMRLNT